MAWVSTDDMVLPVMIPRAADPAVTGVNSSWLIAGAAAASWLLFGSSVSPYKKTTVGGKGLTIKKK